MKPILIIKAPTLGGISAINRNNARLYETAGLVFIKTDSHFRCVKNRWDATDNDERIPNKFLSHYIMQYAEMFTKPELINCIAP